ncbi:uncharacterized protein LOC103957508 isoform X1 [Pyrus x bretschneideri]|uniref:uncharacterized protein LOC103957508 isoform X1 n=1 Tax=Pyrus x bretschneideri TaxID=225117 RepID=UPI00202FAF96|nr:uncharacterized protein LOC103957508 isoform X1 [Pyrus x bretschneideri]
MTGTTTSFVAARNLTPPRTSPSSPPATSRFFEPPHCSPYRPTTTRVFCKAEMAILCEDCNGIGWLLCDFCKGQKTNVKSETNRIYLRCPSCRAVSFELLLLLTKPKNFLFERLVSCVQSARHSNVSHSQITMMVRRCLFKPPISCIKDAAREISSVILSSANT